MLISTVEVEAARISTAGHLEFADVDDVQTTGDVFPDGFIVRQRVTRLVHISHLHGGANDDFARVRLLATCNQLEQRGFTGPVGADDADDGASRDVHAQVVDQDAITKRLGDVLELDDLGAQAVGHRNEDFLRFIALLVFEIAQFLEAGNTCLALGLAALGVLAHPFQFLLQGLGAGFFTLLFRLQTGLLLVQPGAVVALVRNAVTTVQLQNPLGGVVQEVAIVGDGHHGAGEAVQELFQPVHRLSVQVVGGFVEQQHVRLGQQQAAQRNAALFTAGEHAYLGVPRRQAQGVSCDFQLVLGICASGGNDGLQTGLLCSQGVKVSIGLGIGGVHLFELGLGGKDLTHGLFHAFTHGVLGVELRFLGQIANLDARHRDGFTLDLLVHTSHDLEQR